MEMVMGAPEGVDAEPSGDVLAACPGCGSALLRVDEYTIDLYTCELHRTQG